MGIPGSSLLLEPLLRTVGLSSAPLRHYPGLGMWVDVGFSPTEPSSKPARDMHIEVGMLYGPFYLCLRTSLRERFESLIWFPGRGGKVACKRKLIMTRPLFIGQLCAFVLDNILDNCVNLSHTDVRSNEGAFEKSFPSPSTIIGLKLAGWATFRKTDGSFSSHPPFLNFVVLSLGLCLENFSLYIWRKTFLSKSRIITISNCPLLMIFFSKEFLFLVSNGEIKRHWPEARATAQGP